MEGATLRPTRASPLTLAGTGLRFIDHRSSLHRMLIPSARMQSLCLRSSISTIKAKARKSFLRIGYPYEIGLEAARDQGSADKCLQEAEASGPQFVMKRVLGQSN